jgi:S-adenosylmethionine hydrolase
MAAAPRPIAFLSDFGLSGEWVGICHAVMSRIAPQSRIVDISHFVPTLDIVSGALLLLDSLPYIAEDAVVLAVVDPNVGKDRDIAVVAQNGRLFVGPDNGLLMPALESIGGARLVIEITSPEVIVQPVSPSFQARDILCPAAAHLASGIPVEQLGDELDPGTLVGVAVPEPETEPGKIRCEVLEFNRFGNVKLNVRRAHLEAAGLWDSGELAVEGVSGAARARSGKTYADFEPGEYGVLMDPRGWLTVVRGNPASALEGLGLGPGDQVWVTGSE